MAYDAGHRASFRLALQTLRKSFDFSGRATRSEFAAYYLAVLLVGVVIGVPALFLVEFETRQIIDEAYGWITGFPFIALMVRRLHDQNRTGRWVLLPLAVVAYNTAFRLLALSLGIQEAFELRRAIGYTDWLLMLIAMGTFAAILVEGDKGANRYGPNPRLDDPGSVSGQNPVH